MDDDEEVAAYVFLMGASNDDDDASPREELVLLLLIMVVRKLDRNRVFTSSNSGKQLLLPSWDDVIDEDARVRDDDDERRGALRCRLSVDFDTLLLLLLLLEEGSSYTLTFLTGWLLNLLLLRPIILLLRCMVLPPVVLPRNIIMGGLFDVIDRIPTRDREGCWEETTSSLSYSMTVPPTVVREFMFLCVVVIN